MAIAKVSLLCTVRTFINRCLSLALFFCYSRGIVIILAYSQLLYLILNARVTNQQFYKNRLQKLTTIGKGNETFTLNMPMCVLGSKLAQDKQYRSSGGNILVDLTSLGDFINNSVFCFIQFLH